MSTLYLFDADGTLRHCHDPKQPCPNKPGDAYIPKNVRDWFARQKWGGDICGIVSNQGGVSLGLLPEQVAGQMLYDMVVELTGYHPIPGAIQMCTSMDKSDPMRKPNPGMLLAVMEAYQTMPGEDWTDTVMIGDMDSDRLAAEAVGVRFVHADEFFGESESCD